MLYNVKKRKKGIIMKIGVFDSGIGGLSVLHQAMQMLPQENFIYYADVDHVPYGTKTKEEIIKYSSEAVEFLVQKGVKAIVIACNTATSAAIQELREKYTLPIIGMEPAVKKAIDFHPKKRVLVIATPMTIQGEKLHNLIEKVDTEHLVDAVALPKLVTFAEEENFEEEEVTEYLREALKHFNLENYSSVVLGCTHFNYFKDSLKKMLPKGVHFLDGNEGTIKKLISELEKRKALEKNSSRKIEYYYSGRKLSDIQDITKMGRYIHRLNHMLMIK
ncbi:glutamate racemase [Fusobacterium necrophorum BFTR-1]|uniref:Glutamate racemase n=2 Tax=Fusobacterium necrophorum TaxID=859 RepID=A0AB73BWW0_9FUSO|nr:glutamate racemase [Fusobacterium necrophorum BL]KDE67065.1 glutamate racemase [Fusobacterium necrophorum BFTR-1]KDE74692.1 glutamate racemase [Fusobacterium necrophorum BFTR-2]